jgi:hypothetical protein
MEQQSAEIRRTRETLATMQAQMNRDHQEIAQQRQELLERLGAVEVSGSNGASKPAAAAAAAGNGWQHPKPAAMADQFRKLRRDSKRRAIGV